MSIEEQRRARFEAAITKNQLDNGFAPANFSVFDGEYLDQSVEAAWWGYNAALDSVVIELPKPDDSYCEECNDCWERGVQCSRQAIEAAGLKVKP